MPEPGDLLVTSRQYKLGAFRCQITSDDPQLSQLIDRFLVPFRPKIRGSDNDRAYSLATVSRETVSLIADGDQLLLTGPPMDAVEYLLWEVSQQGINSVTDSLALHAGSLCWRGHGIVLPAPSGSGKSTLVAGLTAAGFGYLSDEVALLDLESGTLHPFPRALWMSRQSIDLVPGLRERLPVGPGDPERLERHVPPDSLRPDAVGKGCPLRCVIVPEHVADGKTVLDPIRRSEAVVSMMTNAFNFKKFGGPGLVALAGIADRIEAYRLRMADLSGAVDLVLEAIAKLSDDSASR